MVESERNCHLTLINTGPTGRSRQIFPNRYQQNALIQAGQTVVVPGIGAGATLLPLGPAGIENVTAICREGSRAPAGRMTDYEPAVFPPIEGGASGRNLAVVFDPPPTSTVVAPSPAVTVSRSSVSFLVVD